MSHVTGFIQKIDDQVWHNIEKLALKHPSGSRTLAIPVALAILVRDLIAAPAKCIEELILTGKSIKAYVVEKDHTKFPSRKRDIRIHLFGVVKYGLITPFSPLVGTINAIISLVNMLDSPIKTAKINVTKQDFVRFIETTKYTPTGQLNTNCVIIAGPYEFAKSIWSRFQRTVKSTKALEQIPQNPFVDNESARQATVTEIELKKKKLEETHQVCTDMYLRLLADNSTQKLDEKSRSARIKKFEEEWRKFQHQLINASDTGEIDRLSFNPTCRDLLLDRSAARLHGQSRM